MNILHLVCDLQPQLVPGNVEQRILPAEVDLQLCFSIIYSQKF